jgi:hypothetical protein
VIAEIPDALKVLQIERVIDSLSSCFVDDETCVETRGKVDAMI